MRLASWVPLYKSKSFPLVYVAAIFDSYTILFLSRCLAKTTMKLATVCKNKPNTLFSGGFCGFLRAFGGMLRGVCGAFWLHFFPFCRFGAKVLWTGKLGGVAESNPHTQPQCTTAQPQAMLPTCTGERRNMLKHSTGYNSHGFWVFHSLKTMPKKN